MNAKSRLMDTLVRSINHSMIKNLRSNILTSKMILINISAETQ